MHVLNTVLSGVEGPIFLVLWVRESRSRATMGSSLRQEFISSISIIGMDVVFGDNASSSRRIFWGALILAGTGFTVGLITTSVIRFLDYPMTIDKHLLHPESIPFPTVTICENTLMGRPVIQDNPSDAAGVYVAFENARRAQLEAEACLSDPNAARQPCTQAVALIEDFADLSNFRLPNQTNSELLLKILDHNADFSQLRVLNNSATSMVDMMMNGHFCRFSNAPCRREQWTASFHEYGFLGRSCATFNNDGSEVVTTGGYGQTLEVMTFMRTEQYFVPLNQTVCRCGFFVYFDKPGKRSSMSGTSIFLMPNQETEVVLVREDSQRLEWKGDCKSGQRLRYLADHFNYTRPTCRAECLSDFIFEKCGCRNAALPGPEDDELCQTIREMFCMKNAYWNLTSSGALQEEHCSYCFPECHETAYKESTTSLAVDYGHEGKKFISFYVLLEKTEFEVTKQQWAYTTGSLLADIGGALGLFLGSAMFTVLQIVDFAFRQMRSSCKSQELLTKPVMGRNITVH